MSRRNFALAIAIILIFFARMLVTSVPGSGLITSAEMQRAVQTSNTEGIFAIGLKLKLSRLTAEDLELIPGLSDKVKNGLLAAKDDMLAGRKDFESIKGIGPKKAALLAAYLEVE